MQKVLSGILASLVVQHVLFVFIYNISYVIVYLLKKLDPMASEMNFEETKNNMNMEKKEWERIYSILSYVHGEFSAGYTLYKNGSNKKKRDEGKRKFESAMLLAKSHIEKNFEVYALLTGYSENNKQGAYFLYDEFNSPHWFERDLPRLLIKIQEKIGTFDSNTKEGERTS